MYSVVLGKLYSVLAFDKMLTKWRTVYIVTMEVHVIVTGVHTSLYQTVVDKHDTARFFHIIMITNSNGLCLLILMSLLVLLSPFLHIATNTQTLKKL